MRTPEQWRQIKEIFHSAIGLKPDERDAFLAKACSGDDALRSEVESLLVAHEKDGSFIDSPAYEAAADAFANNDFEVPQGSKFGSYEILALLGRGGMGQVYLAVDKRLGRKVALKFLPTSFTTDTHRLRRFEREARAASALNHPNILTIHEIGKFDGRQFIATEFIDGVTLRHTLLIEKLSLGRVLDIGMQICSALNAAHQAGIVHRDIKPENIMLRRDGFVKVLDFGLAKLIERESNGRDAEAPTRQIDTAPGVLLGTVNYMAPEQARGGAVDETTDIWALGVVLYEMVTGSVPFSGPTSSHVIVSILEEEPSWKDWPSGEISTEFKWIIQKALRKDKEERHQSARELLGDLKSLKQRVDVTRESTGARLPGRVTPDAGTRSTQEVRKSTTEADLATSGAPLTLERIRNRPSLLILASLLTVVAASFVLYKFAAWQRSSEVAVETASDSKLVAAKQITAWSGLDIYPSLSPDGNSVTYSSDRNGQFEIYIKQLTPGGREIQLTTDGAQNLQPTWSPDGRMIAYTSKTKGGVWIIPAFGGTSRQLTEFGASPAWSPDGSLVALQSASIGDDIAAIGSGALLPSTIWTIAAHGGNARQITKVGEPAGGHGSPSWSPDGKRLVFGSYDPEQTDIWTVSVAGTDLKRIAVGVDPIYAPDGTHIYFASFGANLNLGVSKIKVSESGDPQGEPVEIARTGSSRVKRLTITANGDALAYGALTTTSNLWSVPVSPLTNEAAGPPVALTRDTSHRNSSPSVSPDGKRIAYHVLRVGTRADIWMIDADGANPTQLTTDPGSDMRPSWFADGKQLIFLSRREGKDKLWTIDLASGRENTLLDIAQDMAFPQLSLDGKLILFNSKRSGTTNLWIVPTEGGEPKQLTFDKQTMGFGCWSPDGQFIAFEIKRGDDTHLGLIPASGGEPVQLTFDRGQAWPHSFSPDGDKIAFAGFRDGFWDVWWISRSTRTQKKLTNNSKLNTFVRYPSWSPLGDQIVYEYAEITGNIWLLELK